MRGATKDRGGRPGAEGASRFGRLWQDWDARLSAGETPQSILANASDEDILFLLGGESPNDRTYARDIIATAMINRLHRRQAALPTSAVGVVISAEAAFKAAADGQDAIHRAEELLRAAGQTDLGASVSSSAFASLDATKAAFENAKAHAQSVRKLLAESRIGSLLSDATAAVATRGEDATRGLEEAMGRFGKGDEGREATRAAHAIADAARDAADDAHRRAGGSGRQDDED